MAQRAVNHEDEEEMTKKSGISGLPVYWQDHKRQPQMEWDRWRDLFFMSLMGKYSIQIQEILRVVGTGQNARPRNTALMGGLEYDIAEKKVISLLYLSIGGAGRKTLTDKYPEMDIVEVTLERLLNNCQATFQKQRNRCLDRVKFFQRKQQPNETLSQFWNVLNGLAAKGEFGDQTKNYCNGCIYC